MMSRLSILSLVALLLTPAAVRAQQSLSAYEGQRVRVVQLAGSKVHTIGIGRMLRFASDTAWVLPDSSGEGHVIPYDLATGDWLYVSRGSHRRLQFVGFAAVAGSVVGAVAGYATTKKSKPQCDVFLCTDDTMRRQTQHAVNGFFIGMSAGALVGLAFKHEDWRRIAPP